MKTVPNTPADVIAQLPAGFDKAKESGDLLFFPSTVHKHSEFGVEVSLSPLVVHPAAFLTDSDGVVGDHTVPCIAEQADAAHAALRCRDGRTTVAVLKEVRSVLTALRAQPAYRRAKGRGGRRRVCCIGEFFFHVYCSIVPLMFVYVCSLTSSRS